MTPTPQPGAMEQQIAEAEPMTLIGGTAGLHMAQCGNDHGFSDCPLLRAALNVVIAREQDVQLAALTRQRDELLAALEGLDGAIRREQMSCHKCGERDFVHSLGVTQSLTDSEAAIANARGTAVR